MAMWKPVVLPPHYTEFTPRAFPFIVYTKYAFLQSLPTNKQWGDWAEDPNNISKRNSLISWLYRKLICNLNESRTAIIFCHFPALDMAQSNSLSSSDLLKKSTESSGPWGNTPSRRKMNSIHGASHFLALISPRNLPDQLLKVIHTHFKKKKKKEDMCRNKITWEKWAAEVMEC